MRRLKFLFVSILMVSFFGCEQDDYEFGDIQSPTNLVITADILGADDDNPFCLLYTSPSPRDATLSRMPSSA